MQGSSTGWCQAIIDTALSNDRCGVGLMRTASDQKPIGLVDADIHNTIQSYDMLHKYLPARWRREVDRFAIRFENAGAYFPRQHMNAARSDSWPPGNIPGSDLDFLRAQLLDAWRIDYGIL